MCPVHRVNSLASEKEKEAGVIQRSPGRDCFCSPLLSSYLYSEKREEVNAL